MSEQSDSINISDDTEGHARGMLEGEEVRVKVEEDEVRTRLEDDTEGHARSKVEDEAFRTTFDEDDTEGHVRGM